MLISVETFTGETIVLSVDSSDTIDIVKKQILFKEGIPLNRQYLTYLGGKLDDGRKLSDYNIERDSTLRMSLSLNSEPTKTIP